MQTSLGSAEDVEKLETVVQVAAPKEIEREWRTVVVDNRVVAASQYRSSGRKIVSADVPEEVAEFASEMATKYAPADVFVLDVCSWNDKRYIVETNCFNAAGFYWCDLHAVVRLVTDFVDARFG